MRIYLCLRFTDAFVIVLDTYTIEILPWGRGIALKGIKSRLFHFNRYHIPIT